MALKTKPAKGSKPQNKDYDDTNRGVLFINDKDGNEARPDYTGNIDVNGEKYRLAAWIKNSPKVGDYLSIAVSEIQES